MDILFDARHINQSGIGSYIATELPYLQATAAEHDLSLAVLVNPGGAPPLRESTRVVLAEPADAPMYSVQEQRVWGRALSALRPRAIWLPHYPYPLSVAAPANRGIRCFVTVHDTLHIMPRLIGGQQLPNRMYARAMLGLDARRCARIFTPSHSTADALLDVWPTAPVLVTPLGIDQTWFTPADPTRTPVEGKYILYVGLAKWHKNLPVLLGAFEHVVDAIPHKLVIAGGGELTRNVDERIEALAAKRPDRVVMTGRLDFASLRSLVAGADLLVMPSLHEGVGLPPLEAMASQTAVLASRIPSLMETCGDGAEYFDPHDPQALGDLIRTYCSDDEARAKLAERGLAHVRHRQSGIPLDAAPQAICHELNSTR